MPAKAAHQSFASFWRASVRALLLWDFNNDPLTGSLQLGSFFRGETSAVISTTCAHLVRERLLQANGVKSAAKGPHPDLIAGQ